MIINVINLKKLHYGAALALQEKLLAARQNNKIGDTLLLVEHPPTLTLGMRGGLSNILVPLDALKESGIELYEANRGGDVTYHGPGQIVGYPILNLADYDRDIKSYVRKIEEVFIRLLEKEYQITAQREDKKYTGVWVGDCKITAIGIAVKRWVTMHGFAFNVNTDLEYFKLIHPCGLTDKGVTSLQKTTGREQDFDLLNRLTADYFCEVFEREMNRIELKDLETEL